MSECCNIVTSSTEIATAIGQPANATEPQADSCAVQPGAPDTGEQVQCPRCGSKGKKVDTLTVKALLAVSLARLRAQGYRFCRTPDCPVVYFSTDGQEVYGEEALREQVHQKHPTAEPVFVCYCFRHTPGSIRQELLAHGKSTVVEAIQAGIAAGQCACEIRNPQGSCCLGNVTATVRRLEAELAAPVAG